MTASVLEGSGTQILVSGDVDATSVPARDVATDAQTWREGRLPVEELVSSRLALDDPDAGIDGLAAGRTIRQVIEMSGSPAASEDRQGVVHRHLLTGASDGARLLIDVAARSFPQWRGQPGPAASRTRWSGDNWSRLPATHE